MQSQIVTAGSVKTLASGGPRAFIHITNTQPSGGATLYVKYDGGSTAVSTANGTPIYPGGTLQLNNDGMKPIFDKSIDAISDGVDIDVRLMGE